MNLIDKTNKFKSQEDKDAKEILAKREQILSLETEMRKLSETVIVVQNEAAHFQRVKEVDSELKNHRQELVLQNLKQALGDATHHLKWLQHRNEAESNSQTQIAAMKIADPVSQIEMDENTA